MRFGLSSKGKSVYNGELTAPLGSQQPKSRLQGSGICGEDFGWTSKQEVWLLFSWEERIPTWIALDTSSEDRDGTRQQGDKGSEGMDTKPYTGTTRADSFVQITIEQ